MSRARARERVLGCAVALLLGVVVASNGRHPTDSVHVDGDGAYVERSRWWGLSTTTLPLRRADGGWEIRTPAGWMPYSDVADDTAPTDDPPVR